MEYTYICIQSLFSRYIKLRTNHKFILNSKIKQKWIRILFQMQNTKIFKLAL
jgi:hypothetical protein